MSTYCERFYRAGAVLWGLIALIIVACAAITFDAGRVKTDVRSLVPAENSAAQAAELLTSVADAGTRRVFVTVDAETTAKAQRAALATEDALRARGLIVTSADAESFARTRTFLLTYRETQLTSADREYLQSATPENLQKRALKNLYRPVSSAISSWQDDPLGLFADRFQEIFSDARFSVQGHFLTVENPAAPETRTIVLNVTAPASFTLSGTPMTQALAAAKKAATSAEPSARIDAAGPVLMSEAATQAAQHESTLIGTVSAVAVAAMVLFFLRALMPAVWMVATLALSFLVAVSSVWLAFGEIHLLTLVFGATLLGVAADYVFHFLTELFHAPDPAAARNELAGGLFVSLLTSLAGYSVMFFVPMPALRQMALFCIAGLTSAFLFVMLTGPIVTQTRPMPVTTRAWAEKLTGFLRLAPEPAAIVIVILLITLAPGLTKLKTGDELQLLNSIPVNVLTESQRVSKLVAPASPGQFFVVRGDTTDDVLERLAKLKIHLEKAVNNHVITGFTTGEGPLLSSREQDANRRLVSSANAAALTLAAEKIHSEIAATSALTPRYLTLKTWLNSDAGRLFTSFWPSETETVVFLSGVTPESLAPLSALASDTSGVSFINTTGEIRKSLASWRDIILSVLAGAFVLMAAFLALIYRQRALRMVIPTALGLLSAAGLLGWLGIPVSLFTVLPMVLLLGLGADYAVLLYGKPAGCAVHLSVFLAAMSTLLSFGLLAFSSTPALRHFGLALSIGLTFVWLYTMLLRPKAACH